MKYLAIYCYEAPDGTFSEGSPRPKETVAVYGDLEMVSSSLSSVFDGLETFNDFIEPELLDHFDEVKKGIIIREPFAFYDNSSGQRFKVVQITDICKAHAVSL